MKIAFYQMRPFDEQAYIEQFSREFGIDYVTIPGAPCPENLDKAAGCDAVSQNPCEILPEYVEAWARMGPAAASAMIISRWTPPKSWVCASATATTRRKVWPTTPSC